MTTPWRYTPVTIHFERHHDPTEKHAVSGVFLLNAETNKHHIICLSDIPNPDRHSFICTAAHCVNSDSIDWIQLILCDVKSLHDQALAVPPPIVTFTEKLQKDDRFVYKPHRSSALSILHFRFTPHQGNLLTATFFDSANTRPLTFRKARSVPIPSKVTIEACPFSLTNVALFISHRLFGSVVLNFKDSGFLSDIKFLDDIIGGVVTLDSEQGESIGLVAGALHKLNGDGELLLIVSWDCIFQMLKYIELPLTDSPTLPVTLRETNVKFTPAKSVVRISVRSNEGSFWGSGVCISDELIVTNKHVLKSLESLKDILIHVPFQPHLRFSLKDVTIYTTPLDGFDMCFIKLNKACSSLVPAKLGSEFIYGDDFIRVGDRVTSVGHGLFFAQSATNTIPLSSEGRINNIVETTLDASGTPSKTLIIASAGCWNGSSGGGLFNTKNELVGLMTSNGKLSSGEVMPKFTLAIPVNIIERSLFLLENNLPSVDLKQKIQDLWSLKGTREHRLQSLSGTSVSKL